MPMTVGQQNESAREQADFIELLSRQRDLYGELARLTDEQHQLIVAGEVERMVAILNQRRVIIDRLNATNTRLTPLRERWDQMLPSVPSAQRDQVRAILSQVQAFVTTIMAQDEDGRRLLQTSRDDKAKQLKHTTQSNRAMRAYTPQAPAIQPRFTDSQG